MELKYSVKPEDKEKTVKAIGRDMNISFKDAVVIADKIRSMNLDRALLYLEKVTKLEQAVPYKRYQIGIGHRKGNAPKIAKYPKKAAKHIIEVLKNIQANAKIIVLNNSLINQHTTLLDYPPSFFRSVGIT